MFISKENTSHMIERANLHNGDKLSQSHSGPETWQEKKRQVKS